MRTPSLRSRRSARDLHHDGLAFRHARLESLPRGKPLVISFAARCHTAGGTCAALAGCPATDGRAATMPTAEPIQPVRRAPVAPIAWRRCRAPASRAARTGSDDFTFQRIGMSSSIICCDQRSPRPSPGGSRPGGNTPQNPLAGRRPATSISITAPRASWLLGCAGSGCIPVFVPHRWVDDHVLRHVNQAAGVPASAVRRAVSARPLRVDKYSSARQASRGSDSDGQVNDRPDGSANARTPTTA